MRENMLLSDAQATVNEDSTGTIFTNYLDLEKDSAANALVTDEMIMGYLNVVLTAYSYTADGTEGVKFEVRTDDAVTLATAKDGAGVGYIVLAAKEIPLERIEAGMKISIPFLEPVAKRYLGGFVLATSTTFNGTITFDAWFDNKPISGNESIQKVPS